MAENIALEQHGRQARLRAVEDYRPGYPRYAALLASHPAFQNFRRFTRLRMRMLLLQQDEVSLLEESLDKIDAAEDHDFFLGCSRRDRNPERRQILQKLKAALNEYDIMMQQNHHILSLPGATTRDLESLKNWVEGVGSISRDETGYLNHATDQLNVTGSTDQAVTWIETAVEDCSLWFGGTFRKYFSNGFGKRVSRLTKDENVFVLRPKLQTLSRILTIWIATIILLVPIIILYSISSPKARLIVIVFSSGFFLSMVSMFTKARTIEVIVAGASYAAVLVVFTSANNGLQ